MKFNKILLIINIFFLQAYLIRFSIGPYPTNLQEILIAANALVFLFAVPFREIITSIKKHWVILTLVGLAILSIILVPIENQLDFIRHSKFLVFGGVLVFIFLETFKNEDQRDAGIRIAGVGALVFGLFSLIYNLLGYNAAHDFRLLGPLDAAVYLAFYLAPFFIFFAIKFFENPKKKSNLIYAILLLALIIATRSMGAIGGTMLVMLIYFFKRSNLNFLKSAAAKIIIAILSLIVLLGIFYTKILPTYQTEWSSLDERGEIWLTSAEFLKNPSTSIFGLGFGQFQDHYFKNVAEVLGHEPLDYYVLQPHNIFLLFQFNFGLPGLLFIIFIILLTIKALIKFKGKPDLRIIAYFMLLYFFIHGLIDTPFFKNDMLILFILILETASGVSLQTGNQIHKH